MTFFLGEFLHLRKPARHRRVCPIVLMNGGGELLPFEQRRWFEKEDRILAAINGKPAPVRDPDYQPRHRAS